MKPAEAPDREDALDNADSGEAKHKLEQIGSNFATHVDNICRDTSTDNMDCGGCGNECCSSCNPVQTSHPGGPSYGYCK